MQIFVQQRETNPQPLAPQSATRLPHHGGRRHIVIFSSYFHDLFQFIIRIIVAILSPLFITKERNAYQRSGSKGPQGAQHFKRMSHAKIWGLT